MSGVLHKICGHTDFIHNTNFYIWYLSFVLIFFMFSFASVYISKEIIQAKDRGKYTTAEIENHLIKALTKPTGKDRGGSKIVDFYIM